MLAISMRNVPFRAVPLAIGVGILMVATALTVSGETRRDRNGIPMRVDAKSQTVDEAAGGSAVGVCAIDGQPWPPLPPTEAAVASAKSRGAGVAVDAAYSIGPIEALARANGLDLRWTDGRTVYAIDRTATLPTVVGLDMVVVGSTELWLETYQLTLGACDGDQVPTAPEP
jgi:hypothetical protein